MYLTTPGASSGYAFQPGDLIAGRYRLLRVLGSGAMGMVWSARNEATDRDFALKLMLPSSANSPSRLQRFFQEAKACGRLRHRCIVEVYDLGRIESIVGKPADPHAGTPYIVMELLEGETLDDFCRRLGAIPSGTVLRIIGDVAQGLEAAHRAGIVHRDLKPANLFLHKGPDGSTTPKILDFGISKLVFAGDVARDPSALITGAGTVLGSPAYMSPEQTMGDSDIDARSDVWSLGVILYRALSGEMPFRGQGYRDLVRMIGREAPRPLLERVPILPIEVVRIVERCLQKDRAARFQTAQALAEACASALATRSLPRLELSSMIIAPVELPNEVLSTVAASEGAIALQTPAFGFHVESELPAQETSPTRSILGRASDDGDQSETNPNRRVQHAHEESSDDGSRTLVEPDFVHPNGRNGPTATPTGAMSITSPTLSAAIPVMLSASMATPVTSADTTDRRSALSFPPARRRRFLGVAIVAVSLALFAAIALAFAGRAPKGDAAEAAKSATQEEPSARATHPRAPKPESTHPEATEDSAASAAAAQRASAVAVAVAVAAGSTSASGAPAAAPTVTKPKAGTKTPRSSTHTQANEGVTNAGF